MRIIKPKVEEIVEKDPFLKIEKVGRTCYKSTSPFTDESAGSFYRQLVARKHTAMLEHACFVFQVSEELYDSLMRYYLIKMNGRALELPLNFTSDRNRFLVSGNLRALNELEHEAILGALFRRDSQLVYIPHSWDLENWEIKLVDLEELENLTPNEIMHHRYVTLRFFCDRGVSHEMVRHRPCSFAQESTRYCNYSSGKFGREISVIEPLYLEPNTPGYRIWEKACIEAESSYLNLLNWGCSPQEARSVLPNSLKTEVVVTTNMGEWAHIVNLRYVGITGSPHPQMREVMGLALPLLDPHFPKEE